MYQQIKSRPSEVFKMNEPYLVMLNIQVVNSHNVQMDIDNNLTKNNNIYLPDRSLSYCFIIVWPVISDPSVKHCL